ncbi:hypothetical protein [Spirosoma pollinicola]|uniref:Lipoprotein n=1 Tax=Spirosoma pollinicola TaxID=2057025 RepID=A0A2K8Z2Q9_9BACT|nr:hypothetical protein [Spirosoma pollinicola]AUD04158.1 hypothetical protein CWM47_21360 [Spirosoma pollinicola]
MKRVYFLFLFWALVSLSGCEKDIPADCAEGGAFVKRVDNAIGTVYYDSIQTKYVIRVPNSMDSHDVGYLCALDTKYQQNGLQVKFSGRYYEYYKTLPMYLVGDRNYSLSIETISLH